MAVMVTINGHERAVEVDPGEPLLWVLRDRLGLVGAKYGCGVGLCGACTVHVDGAPVRSCLVNAEDLAGASVTTIEGLANPDGSLHPVQQAWVDVDAPQCGYCQSGQIMSAVALLADNANPDDADIDAALGGNLCRCGTYVRIRAAVRAAAAAMAGDG